MNISDELNLSIILEQLIRQIEMGDFTDSEGHDLKMLDAYCNLKEFIKNPPDKITPAKR